MEPRPGIEPGTCDFPGMAYKAAAPPLSYRGTSERSEILAKISSIERIRGVACDAFFQRLSRVRRLQAGSGQRVGRALLRQRCSRG